MDNIKIKNFCSLKDTIKRVKRKVISRKRHFQCLLKKGNPTKKVSHRKIDKKLK